VIPDDAVEAAARAMAPNEFGWGRWPDHYRERARKALEAAAPHLVAEARSAWHDAVSETYIEGAISAAAADLLWARNPYRKPPDAV
jgi:hypothetical protein